MASALLGLERNWAGDIGGNAEVRRTLSALQAVEESVNATELAADWRLLAYLYRGYFDAHVQARFRSEAAQQARAYAALRGAPDSGSRAALAAALGALAANGTDAAAAAWRARAVELAALANRSVGAEVLQSQAADLNLATLGAALSDAPWLAAELPRVAALATEQDRQAAIRGIVGWEDPGSGGRYDRLGSGALLGLAPHLDRGAGAASDPAFYYTPLSAAFRGGAAQRAAWGSFSQAVGEGYRLTLRYDGLDPRAAYNLSVLFFATTLPHSGGADAERNTLTAGGTVLQRAAPSAVPMRPVTFAVPRVETASGALRVTCEGARDDPPQSSCSIVAVWLRRTDAPPRVGGGVSTAAGG